MRHHRRRGKRHDHRDQDGDRQHHREFAKSRPTAAHQQTATTRSTTGHRQYGEATACAEQCRLADHAGLDMPGDVSRRRSRRRRRTRSTPSAPSAQIVEAVAEDTSPRRCRSAIPAPHARIKVAMRRRRNRTPPGSPVRSDQQRGLDLCKRRIVVLRSSATLRSISDARGLRSCGSVWSPGRPSRILPPGPCRSPAPPTPLACRHWRFSGPLRPRDMVRRTAPLR